MDLSEIAVNEKLILGNIDVPATDYANLLKFAQFLFLAEFISKSGKITANSGQALISHMGKMMVRFNKENMFFMRTGDVKRPLQYMRDHETMHQMGMQLVNAYITYDFRKKNGQLGVEPAMGFDMTRDGWGANVLDTVIDADEELSRGGTY